MRFRPKKIKNIWLLLSAAVVVLVLTVPCFALLARDNAPHKALEPFLTHRAEVTVCEPLDSADGEILRYEITQPRGHAKAWVFPDGSLFWCEESTDAFTLRLYGFSSEQARHLDASKASSPFLAESDGRTVLIQPPLAREAGDLDGTNYIAVPAENGAVTCRLGTVKVRFQGEQADWWAYVTPGNLADGCEDGLEWLTRCTMQKFGDANRMTLDGYYYQTPSDYIPTGTNYFYRLPAAYIPVKLARYGNSHHGRQIGAAMLDIQTEHYCEDGYIPTLPASGWLKTDYAIGAGFYDTRFNTDVAHALLTLGRTLGIDKFTNCALDYAAFLTKHAEEHSFSTENGILVHDYCHKDGNLPTLTSLNHQLAEILFLYETEDAACVETAEKMLHGIEDLQEDWVRDDGDLHYAHLPDGTFGRNDYPYLTYNDLLALDRYLGGNEALQYLMEVKMAWMTANGVTEYNK